MLCPWRKERHIVDRKHVPTPVKYYIGESFSSGQRKESSLADQFGVSTKQAYKYADKYDKNEPMSSKNGRPPMFDGNMREEYLAWLNNGKYMKYSSSSSNSSTTSQPAKRLKLVVSTSVLSSVINSNNV